MILQIGKHKVRHGDMMNGFGELQCPKVDYIYSDPPWGDGNLKYWQTMNAKMNNITPGEAASTEAFLGKFFGIVRDVSKMETLVFVEYGLKWQEQLTKAAQSIGLVVHAVSNPRYGSTSLPLALFTMSYGTIDLTPGYSQAIAKTKGFKTLLAATDFAGMTAGQVILDPCCGLGYTARLAVKHGMAFYGNELNRKRLQSTIDILTKDKAK